MPLVAKTIALIACGSIHNPQKIASLIRPYECKIAVDGGLFYLDQMGITPDLIIGDLDSAPIELVGRYPQVPVRKYLTSKDETDLELALKATYHPGVEKMTLFGGLEKRTDHALCHFQLLRRYPGKLFIESEEEIIFVVDGTAEISCTPGQTLSFFNLGGEVERVTSKGLKWEFDRSAFSKNFFSVSNVCLSNKVELYVGKGDLICIMQKS